jgi:ABC-2 type transport system permease protein
MRIFDIANKDFRQLVRDWQTLFFLLVMPVVFTVMFGFLFSGGGVSESDARLPVGYLDMDNGALSPDLMSLLSESTVIRLVETGKDQSELEEAVLDDELAAVVIVPAGFSQMMMDGESIPLTVIVSSGSSSGYTIQGETQAVAMRLKSAVRGAQISIDSYEGLVGFGDEDAREAYFEEISPCSPGNFPYRRRR